MKARFDGYNWLVKLEKGEELTKSLVEIVKKENIKTGWVYGIGAASSAEIGIYDLAKKDYKWQKLDKDLEILGLQGNISYIDNEPAIHLHGSFSNESMQAFGGHIKELTVSVTCEIFIHNWFSQDSITRSLDKETGLNLLDV